MDAIEQHPLTPFLPANAHILILGSFPPQKKRWSMDFYYPNWNNDMWRITGLIFFHNPNHFVLPDKKAFDKKKLISFLGAKGIALFDTASAVRRLQDNASDKYLEIVTPTEISTLISQLPNCKAVATTGEKATDTLCTQLRMDHPKIGTYETFRLKNREMRLYRMPSSSRAYPLSLEKKAAAYRAMYQELQML